MTSGYLRRLFTWYEHELGLLGHEPAQLPEALREEGVVVPPPALLAHCRWLCQRALATALAEYEAARANAVASKQGRTINKCVTLMDGANRLLWKLVQAVAYMKGVTEALGLLNTEAAQGRYRAMVDETKKRPAVSRVLLVAEVEVEDPGFASDYILEAVAALAAAGVPGVRKVEAAAHPELKQYFLPRVEADPLTRPDGTVLPLSYSLDDGGPDDGDRP